MTTFKDLLMPYHHPEFITTPESGDGGHVCQVWEDGEVTLSKGGSLWLQRSMHMIEPGRAKALPIDEFPRQMWGHGCVIVKFDDYPAVQQLILDEISRR